MTNVEIGEITARNLQQLMKACKLTDATLVARREDGQRIVISKLNLPDPDPVIDATTRGIVVTFHQFANNTEEVIIVNKNPD